jgi:DNA-binding CsgD family transcriptional regulator
MEILRLVATGATNQQIAQELVISVNTVKVHLRNIYEKLGVASRTEATVLAVRQGWVEVPRQGEAEAPLPSGPEPVPAAAPAAAPPALERWPSIPLFKRVSLVVALLLAAVALAVPLVLRGQAGNGATNPISAVFPTAPAEPSTERWRTRAQMPTPRSNLAMVAQGDLIYAIGGVSNDGVTGKVEVYDPVADAWTAGRPKPTPVGFASAGAVGDQIYLFGGIGAGQQVQDVVEVYDPAADTWSTRAPMPAPLAAYGLAVWHDQFYLFGGLGAQGYVSSVYRYDPAADRWQEMGPMDVAHGFSAAATVGDRIYLVGGYDDVNEFNTCDVYDPVADTWAPAAPMGLRRAGLALVPVRGQLYAIGGGMAGYLAFNERYDPRVDAWSPLGTPVKEQWQGLGAAFVSPYIYAIGGWSGGNLSVNEAYQALFQSLVPVVPQ